LESESVFLKAAKSIVPKNTASGIHFVKVVIFDGYGHCASSERQV